MADQSTKRWKREVSVISCILPRSKRVLQLLRISEENGLLSRFSNWAITSHKVIHHVKDQEHQKNLDGKLVAGHSTKRSRGKTPTGM